MHDVKRDVIIFMDMDDKSRYLKDSPAEHAPLPKKVTDAFYWSPTWQAKRKAILKRDHYECQRCRDLGRVTTKEDSILVVHHMHELKENWSKRLSDEHLLTLCFDCHEFVHGRCAKGDKAKRWADEWW